MKRTGILTWLGIALAGGIAASCASLPDHGAAPLARAQDETNPVAATPQSIARGQTLYQKLGCIDCHGPGGAGDGAISRGERLYARDFTNPHWQAALSDGELRYRIFRGSNYGMPAQEGRFRNPEEVWNVINYLRTLGASPP